MLATAFTFLVLATACGGGEQPKTPLAPTAAGGSVNLPDVRFDASRLSGAPDLSRFQRDMLGDGVLTFAEYERAVFAHAQCLREKGADIKGTKDGQEVDGPVLNKRGVFEWRTLYPATFGGDFSKMRAVDADCSDQFVSVVVQLWQEGRAPTQQDIAEARHSLARCMRDAGLDIAEDAGPSEFERFLIPRADQHYIDCIRQTGEMTGLPGFTGG